MANAGATVRPWPYQRGFAAIGLHRPKGHENIGATLRAAHCHGAALVAIAGERCTRSPLDTMHAYRHIPVISGDDLHPMVPFDCIPIAVDLLPDAIPLPAFQHPQRAFYIFGPEDGTLGKEIHEWCKFKIVVPTRGCMNLAATVNVVLYDRIAKAMCSARKEQAA
jgi:tRNA(Leu) C34 or U34 (ribose-2'-O)-methylase TrmL